MIYVDEAGTEVIPVTVTLLLRADAVDGELGAACDYFSGMFSDNCEIADWAYAEGKAPSQIVTLEPGYTEGEYFSKGGAG